ncbi:MAG: histidinol-phosphate transaminase [Eubacterium sp.]|nr:histidinol-phosphate transaminase [Eubacterium sp.]
MSRYLDKRYEGFKAYESGEQPGPEYIRLNTNESPFPPSPKVIEALKGFDVGSLRFYSDPFCTELRRKLAEKYDVELDNIIVTNGSDDALNYVFQAFNPCPGPEGEPTVVFPDITYNFYEVLCGLHGVSYRTIPIEGDMTIDPEKFMNTGCNVVMPNPNAPTGIALPLADIEKIVSSNAGRAVLIDQAYVDFGWESAVPLIKKYDNLIVCHTYSKSRSFAGGRVGFAVASKSLIADLLLMQQSQAPYNVNGVSQRLAEAALDDDAYYQSNIEIIKENRRYTRNALMEMGFKVLPSATNFVFAKHPDISGEDLYRQLKDRKILIRHFNNDRIRNYNRITIGTREQMDTLLAAVADILSTYPGAGREQE